MQEAIRSQIDATFCSLPLKVQAPRGGMEVLARLFIANEDFRGRVRRTHIHKEVQAVSCQLPTFVLPTSNWQVTAILKVSSWHAALYLR